MGLLWLSVLLTFGIVQSQVHSAFSIPAHLKEEGHRIAKRFADHRNHHFQSHDIAEVLHETQPATFHHVQRRDLTNLAQTEHGQDLTTLRLAMKSSSDHLTLTLKKRAIVDGTTEFVIHTKNGGRVRRSPVVNFTEGCFGTGHVAGSPKDTVAAVSMCNGLHGIVNSKGMDYYIHPVEREADGDKHQVHILRRRSLKRDNSNNDDDNSSFESYDDDDAVEGDDDDDDETNNDHLIFFVPGDSSNIWKTARSFTVEMALFTDAAGWKILQKLVPGREDEYMLVGVAAANALYGDRRKVGYNVNFQVKLLEYWQEDPEEYDFQENTLHNLRSYCKYTTKKYTKPQYDMHLLHTGIASDGNIAGKGFTAGVCRSNRCVALRVFSPGRFQLIAHEIGHNLGFKHHQNSKCPDRVKKLPGGMMGNGDGYGYDFSPCNKWELRKLFKNGKGTCLFKRNVKVKNTVKVKSVQPKLLPGQNGSPDKQCELYAGFGYKYFRPYEHLDNGTCRMFLCINANKSSPGYDSIIWITTPRGFPCGDEKMCVKDCHSWVGDIAMGWNVKYPRKFKKQNKWSRWPKRWSNCSSTCGNGVQTKERECMIDEGPFVSPYCAGSDNIKARLCAQTPCDGEPSNDKEIIKHRADKMCSNFHSNGVKLSEGMDYKPMSKQSTKRKYYFSTSCLVACQRHTTSSTNIDGLLPSGTPCTDTTREDYDLERFGIELRCVRGKCLEFSNCKNNEPKDKCGVCTNIRGYNATRCVYETISVAAKANQGRVYLTSIPSGSSQISVLAKHVNNGRLEIWSGNKKSDKIWGKGFGSQFGSWRYLDGNEVKYAGARWSLDYKRFIRADGPTNDSIVLKWNVGDFPDKKVIVSYLLPLERNNEELKSDGNSSNVSGSPWLSNLEQIIGFQYLMRNISSWS